MTKLEIAAALYTAGVLLAAVLLAIFLRGAFA